MAYRTSPTRRLVGLVGGAASGKDTVAGFFEAQGYAHVSSSDLVRTEIANRGLTTSRELQTQIANELRQLHGPDYWVEASLKQLGSAPTRAVVSGLYSPAEGECVINKHAGVLVSVVAGEGDDSAIRYARLRGRSAGARDALSFETFLAAHIRETSGRLPHETNLNALHDMAQFVIYNTADLAYLQQQTAEVVTAIERSYA